MLLACCLAYPRVFFGSSLFQVTFVYSLLLLLLALSFVVEQGATAVYRHLWGIEGEKGTVHISTRL